MKFYDIQLHSMTDIDAEKFTIIQCRVEKGKILHM